VTYTMTGSVENDDVNQTVEINTGEVKTLKGKFISPEAIEYDNGLTQKSLGNGISVLHDKGFRVDGMCTVSSIWILGETRSQVTTAFIDGAQAWSTFDTAHRV